MPVQTAIPSVSSIVSRAQTPTQDWTGAVSTVQVVDNIYCTAIPFVTSGGIVTGSESNYLYLHGFGYSFTGTDTLVSISAHIVAAGTGSPIPVGTSLAFALDTIQCYNGSTIGSAATYSGFTNYKFTDVAFDVPITAAPTIAQINNANFGLIIGLTGSVGGNPVSMATFELDQVQLTITTSSGGGGPQGGVAPSQINWTILPVGQITNDTRRLPR